MYVSTFVYMLLFVCMHMCKHVRMMCEDIHICVFGHRLAVCIVRTCLHARARVCVFVCVHKPPRMLIRDGLHRIKGPPSLL